MQRILVLLLVGMLFAGCAPAAGSTEDSIAVQEAWARPAQSGGNSAIYFTIDNTAGQEDRLVEARCSAAHMVEMHMTTTDADGNSKMAKQNAVAVPAGEVIHFEPGGLHVMLMNLSEDLEPGQSLPFTLVFEKMGEVQIEAEVREP